MVRIINPNLPRSSVFSQKVIKTDFLTILTVINCGHRFRLLSVRSKLGDSGREIFIIFD